MSVLAAISKAVFILITAVKLLHISHVFANFENVYYLDTPYAFL